MSESGQNRTPPKSGIWGVYHSVQNRGKGFWTEWYTPPIPLFGGVPFCPRSDTPNSRRNRWYPSVSSRVRCVRAWTEWYTPKKWNLGGVPFCPEPFSTGQVNLWVRSCRPQRAATFSSKNQRADAKRAPGQNGTGGVRFCPGALFASAL